MFLYDIKDNPKIKTQSIPLPYLLPKTPSNKIFYQNGLSKIIHGLHLKVHSHIEECERLWNIFSPKQSLFDLWDFRYAWWEGYHCIPYFYTIYESRTPLALLPLWFDTDKKRFEWFGSEWMEDNMFMVKDEDFINVLLRLIPKSMYLNTLETVPHTIIEEIEVRRDKDKYVSDISSFSHIEEYLQTLKKKHRYNLRRDYYTIKNLNPRIEITDGKKYSDEFGDIVRLSLQRFSGEEKSDFRYKEDVDAGRAILKNSGLYTCTLIKVFIRDYLAAVDLIAHYNDRYYMLIGGANDVERFPGIGNFMVYHEFDDAIKNNFNVVDCLQVDYSWKHKYFTPKKLLEIEKKI
ncbi:MAG TPA: GNAT family N-acetyltransferase [Patescibacteria group bacterium]|nr:GNAT family N-acetyltransferase [Patescibacteria group bacterium]